VDSRPAIGFQEPRLHCKCLVVCILALDRVLANQHPCSRFAHHFVSRGRQHASDSRTLSLLCAYRLPTATFDHLSSDAKTAAFITTNDVGPLIWAEGPCTIIEQEVSALRSPLSVLWLLLKETGRMQTSMNTKFDTLKSGMVQNLEAFTMGLDTAITSTEGRSYWQELVLCVHDVYPFLRLWHPKTVSSSISVAGLEPLYEYNSRTSSIPRDSMVPLLEILRTLLQAYDQHEMVFATRF